MGLIREPLDVDFVVDSTPLTEEEKEAISKHIREYKAKMTKKNIRASGSRAAKSARKKKVTA